MVICKQWHVYCSLTDGNLNTNPASLVRDKRRIWRASLEAQTVKNLLTVQEARVQSLGGEDPLEKGVATHSSILAWRIPWAEESGGLQSMGYSPWLKSSLGGLLAKSQTRLSG